MKRLEEKRKKRMERRKGKGCDAILDGENIRKETQHTEGEDEEEKTGGKEHNGRDEKGWERRGREYGPKEETDNKHF